MPVSYTHLDVYKRQDHRWKFPDGTSLDPGELLLVSADTVGRIYQDQTDTYEEGAFQEAIGIGSGDSIRLYDSEGTLQDEYTLSLIHIFI